MDEYIQNMMKNQNKNENRDSDCDYNNTEPDISNKRMDPNPINSQNNIDEEARFQPPPNIIQSEWAFYAVSGLMLWNVYRKYFSQKYTIDGKESGCPVLSTDSNEMKLNFN